MRSHLTSLFPAAAFLSFAGAATADIIYETHDPFGGPFGLIGFDVCPDQRVGCRFTPDADYTLDRVRVWFMNNNFDGRSPSVTVTLRPDAGTPEFPSVPSETVIESWTINISAVGWDPQLEEFNSAAHTLLEEGVNYWIVAVSGAPCGDDPVWNWAASDSGFTAIDNQQAGWMSGDGATGAMIVEGTPATSDCPADFDGDGFVTGLDFDAFVAAFEAGDDRADFDGDGFITGLDFDAFVLAFEEGC